MDPHDEPSAEWGWHGSFPRGKIIAGVVCILLLMAFIFGPYQSHTQDAVAGRRPRWCWCS